MKVHGVVNNEESIKLGFFNFQRSTIEGEGAGRIRLKRSFNFHFHSSLLVLVCAHLYDLSFITLNLHLTIHTILFL